MSTCSEFARGPVSLYDRHMARRFESLTLLLLVTTAAPMALASTVRAIVVRRIIRISPQVDRLFVSSVQ